MIFILISVMPTLSFLVGCGGKESPPAITNFNLNLAINGGGNINPSAGAHTFEKGTVVNLTATPDVGWKFDSWTGDISGTSATISVTMDRDKSISAHFSKVISTYVLTTSLNGSGTIDPTAGKYTYEAGTVINVTATPSTGWKFDGWTGDISETNTAISLTLDGDKSIAANFSKVKYVLTISLNGSGTVEPTAGTHAYDIGTVVNLTATPARGWKFVGWSGDIAETTSVSTVTMDSNKTAVANFSSMIIFEDNFDSETTAANPSKWTVVDPSDTDVSIDDTVYFGTSGKSAKMQDNSNTDLPQLYKDIGSQTGTLWYEVSVRCAQTNVIEGVLYISNGKAPGGSSGLEGIGVSITFWSDGYIKYIVSGVPYVWGNIQTYQADKWYTVKVFVDVPKQKYDIYIDGVLKVSDVNFRFPLTSLDRISFVARVEPPSSTLWIDNVLVTKVP